MKKYSRIIIVLVIALTLSGCGEDNTTDSTVTPTPTPVTATSTTNNDQVTILWWNLFEPVENIQPLIDSYEESHPNVDIQYEQKGVVSGVDGYVNELDYALTDGDELTTPDIFTIHNTWAGRYDTYISKATNITDTELEDFYPVIKGDFVRNGVSAIPLSMDSLAVIYNVNATAPVTKPSGDWSTFKLDARNMSKDGIAGFSAGVPQNTEFYFDVLNLLFMQNGVQMTDQAGTQATFASSGNDASDALSFYYNFSNSDTPTWDSNRKKDIAEFLEGNLAMYIAPSWRLSDILLYNNEYNLGLDVRVAAIPQLGGDDKTYWATYWGQTVAKDSRFKEESWDFLEYLTQADQLRSLNAQVLTERPVGIIYPRLSMQQEIIDNQYLSSYVVAVDNAKSWYMGDGIKMKELFTVTSDEQLNLSDIENAATNILTNPNLEQ